ncbi:MAG: hypothetical protein ACREN7_10385 [Candidatus Dormibacteria bacterium]
MAGGIAGAFGQFFHNSAITALGVATYVLIPTDGLWHAAIWAAEPPTLARAESGGFDIAFGSGSGPAFISSSGPSVAYLAWVGVWLAALLILGSLSFQTREA